MRHADETAYMLLNEGRQLRLVDVGPTQARRVESNQPDRPSTDRVEAPPLSCTGRAATPPRRRSLSGVVAFLLLGICGGGESNRTLELFPSEFSPPLTN